MTDWMAALLAAPAIGALGLTAFNLSVWPRGRRGPSVDESIAILIPARNEAETIERCVRSALRQPGVVEVIVYDDNSTDRTPDILARLSEDDARLRVLEGVPLPSGWVGKPHACHRLAQAATADLLFFVDADVELKPDATLRLQALLQDYGADALTAVPAQQMKTFAERLVMPLLHLTYVSWLPLPLIWRSSDPRFLAANGQLLAVRRTAYDDVGGFGAVRDAVVDDMAFCRRLKNAKHRLVFADGDRLATCRMYDSTREVWEGFSKNIFEGVGSAPALLFVLMFYFVTFLLPWLLVPLAWTYPVLGVAGLAGVAANVAQRTALVARFRHPWESVLLHPFSIAAFFAIAVNSWRWHARDAIRWSGRSYAKREARNG